MPDLLFEIGCEELPSSAVASGELQLSERGAHLLAEDRIPYTHLETFATPRRLALLARGISDRQDPATTERRGPPLAQAQLPDGSFSPAAVGFARANGVDPEELVRRETAQGEYVFAVRELPGEPVGRVLPDLLTRLLWTLSFPRTMRWDASGLRFPRPIRWIVALLDDEVLPVTVGELAADRVSYGHRVFHPKAVEIRAAGDYDATMREVHVLAPRAERREAVRTEAEKAASELGGRPIVHEGVLDEVTDLVEEPYGFVGRFDGRYLEVPRDVVVVSMEAHQRYFPVQEDDGSLIGGFVVVSNGDPAHAATIASGNERVLQARLSDAVFFFREDAKVPLSARAGRLSELVFHAGLGTMRDKVLRVGSLLAQTTSWLGVPEEDTDAAYFAADVYKADLLTHLVAEFPELEGVMGKEYALRDPELGEQAGALLPKVAEAVGEQYLPRAAGDALPQTNAGIALGLTDRLDTLVGYVGTGHEPSGSEDAFGLRRQATGFAAICLAKDARIPLREGIAAAYGEYRRAGVELRPEEECTARVRDLLVSRTVIQLEREGVMRMLVQAATASAWSDLPELAARARALAAMHADGKLHRLAVAHERAFNLSRGVDAGGLDVGRLEHDAEQDLFGQLQAVEAVAHERAAVRDFEGALATIDSLGELLDTFFDREHGVLVMDPDERVRANRLALLRRTAQVFHTVADFSVVIPAELEGDGIQTGSDG